MFLTWGAALPIPWHIRQIYSTGLNVAAQQSVSVWWACGRQGPPQGQPRSGFVPSAWHTVGTQSPWAAAPPFHLSGFEIRNSVSTPTPPPCGPLPPLSAFCVPGSCSVPRTLGSLLGCAVTSQGLDEGPNAGSSPDGQGGSLRLTPCLCFPFFQGGGGIYLSPSYRHYEVETRKM